MRKRRLARTTESAWTTAGPDFFENAYWSAIDRAVGWPLAPPQRLAFSKIRDAGAIDWTSIESELAYRLNPEQRSTIAELARANIEAWNAISNPIGEFSPEQRILITDAVMRYLDGDAKERGAPFVKDVEAWLARLGAAAAELARVAGSATLADPAAVQAKAEVEHHLSGLLRGNGGARLTVGHVATAIEKSIDRARDGEFAAGFAEGECWGALVGELEGLFKKWKLPTGIRNDGKASPFVVFFAALQAHFPAGARRHINQSVSALAAAMIAALRELKTRTKRR